MKVSLAWAQYYSNVKLDEDGADRLIEKIGAQLGAVDEVIDYGARYKGIVVSKVVSAEKHPNADKLSVCMINDGRVTKAVKRDTKGLVQVVCGAPNVAAGQLVAWIPPGATVPSTFDKDPFVLEAKELRGIVSNGMLASAAELALSGDHSGILVLDKGRPGQALAEVLELDDYVVDIENKMFTHRPDCFGMLGIARELAGIQGKRFKSPAWYKEKPAVPSGKSRLGVNVENEIPKLVPRFCALAIEAVTVGSSPAWLQSYLTRVGVRPINNVVDLTNYYMLLTGQPLHAYDFDKLKTGKLGVRLSKAGEKLTLIGDKSVVLKAGAVVITDGQRPVGLGGVMGGADTEVDETTKNIVLETANFDMNLTRKTAFEYGLFTDAATRFTKGQSPRQNLAVIFKVADDVIRIAGGKVGRLVDDKHLTPVNRTVHVPAQFINERLGLSLSSAEMKRILENVEFRVGRERGKLAVTPPFWRTDIEIPEDIVEEVGRLYGYDHLPVILPKHEALPAESDPMLALKSRIREILKAGGANEVLTYSFVHDSLIEKTGQNPKNAYHIRNAISPDLQSYRLSLIPSLLENVHPNVKAGFDEFALFEIGKAHLRGQTDSEGLPREDELTALVVAASDKLKKSGAAYYEARKYLSYLVAGNLRFKAVPESMQKYDITKPYDIDRAAFIYAGDTFVGIIGEFRASVRQALKLPIYSAGFELDTSSLIDLVGASVYQPLPRFPRVTQDMTLKVPADLSYQELFGFVWDELGKIQPENTLPELGPLDIFQKETDKKSKQITFRLNIASYERTLTDTEVNKLLDDVAAAAKVKFGAVRV